MVTKFHLTMAVGCAISLFTNDSSFLAGKNSPQAGDIPPPLLLSDVVQGPPASDISWEKLKGKVVVLEFWGTRCGACLKAIPHWNQLAAEFASKPVVFLCISDDNKDDLALFLKRTPIQGWVALDQPFSPTRTEFDVVGIPHTVIVNPAGRIAAITHPSDVTAQSLDEILAGKPSTLPPFVPYIENGGNDLLAVSNIAPARVEVSISGPVEVPAGAFNSRGWKKPDYQFIAEKAYLRDALSYFFDITPLLVTQKGKVPDGLYNISAAAPPGQLPQLQAAVVAAVKEKLGITVVTNLQQTQVYSLIVYSSNAPCLQRDQKTGGGGGRPGGFYLQGSHMKAICSFLEDAVNKPVIDESGLTGLWKVDFNWPMSESELLQQRLCHQFYAILDMPPEKIDLEDLPQHLQKAVSSHELQLLKIELAKPVHQRFQPDPVKVIKAARQQLGLDLKLTMRKMPTLLIDANPSSEADRKQSP
ncbi:MAG: TIGR03435 family protein [Verrucomicrobiota bacterium]